MCVPVSVYGLVHVRTLDSVSVCLYCKGIKINGCMMDHNYAQSCRSMHDIVVPSPTIQYAVLALYYRSPSI